METSRKSYVRLAFREEGRMEIGIGVFSILMGYKTMGEIESQRNESRARRNSKS